jgi:dUTP pyrophosphatase
VGAGVVDADYRGPLGIILFNFGNQDFVIKKGDRIAQLILEYCCMAPAVQVEELADTQRGAAGFGSTGVSEGEANKKPRTISPPALEGPGTMTNE